MAYHDETTGAISKAIVELNHISQSMPSLVEFEKVEILSMNAAAELDKLHHEVNQLRSKVATLESTAAQEGFTLEVFWNGNFSGYSCPVCFNDRVRGHTEGCSWHTSRITKRAADGAECDHPISWRQNAICLKCGNAVLPRR